MCVTFIITRLMKNALFAVPTTSQQQSVCSYISSHLQRIRILFVVPVNSLLMHICVNMASPCEVFIFETILCKL